MCQFVSSHYTFAIASLLLRFLFALIFAIDNFIV